MGGKNVGSKDVFGIVLNWNSYENSATCIESLLNLKYQPFHILVIDNNSSDNSGKQLDKEFDSVDVIYNDQNLGFGGGINVGIKYALSQDADYIWVLNNDIICEDDILEELITKMESNMNIGVITPEVRKYPNTDEVWFEQGSINYRTGSISHTNYKGNTNQKSLLLENDYVPFCSALVRCEVFSKIGLYPEDYFLLYGDGDYCHEIRHNGYQIITDTSVHIYHKANQSIGSHLSPSHTYYGTRNRLLFSRKHSSTNSVYLYYIWWFMKVIVDRIIHTKAKSIYAALQGVNDGVLGKKGKGPYPE